PLYGLYRIGIFAGSGVGKSTLLGMISRYSDADVNVIGLIGERGREVLEFIERDLGEEGYKKSVVICATSDQPPLVRLKGAFVATAVAEYFRDQGKKVMFLMDSVTRFAMAQREIGLAVGEPPTTRGYTPSVFANLPKLLERSGMAREGSITAFYTVLVEGDDMNEPIADAVRGILDGHIVLSRKLASKNHFPSIDVQQSISRVMKEIVDDEQYMLSGNLKEMLAKYEDSEDLINVGAYVRGSNPEIDRAIELKRPIDAFLRQDIDKSHTFEETKKQLKDIFKEEPKGEE
ncbi:MAG TPA: flagellum-specific ATP synthase FliI, partial [Eubacteriaceae bacterium]|nr:flagellum-specific ATP synthase FliI [Eubacteriaceae bacterium]